MTTDVLDLPTLVLNRQWQPVHVTTVARSLILLWNDAARVVDPEEYRLLSWSDWAGTRAGRGRALRPVRPAAAAGPRGHQPVALRPAAEHGGHVQPAQRRQARPLHLPVLRCAAWGRVDHDRPRPAALARGNVDLDQLRGRLRALQRPQGRPHSRAGRHAAPPPAGPARVEAILRRAGRADRELGQVPDA